GHLGGELRRRLAADDLFQIALLAAARASAASLGGLLAAHQVQRLLGRHGDEQPPQVVAVVELREAVALSIAAKAVEGADGDILRIGCAAEKVLQALAGQHDELLEIALPELLRGVGVAVLEKTDPVSDRSAVGHGPCPRTRRSNGP